MERSVFVTPTLITPDKTFLMNTLRNDEALNNIKMSQNGHSYLCLKDCCSGLILSDADEAMSELCSTMRDMRLRDETQWKNDMVRWRKWWRQQ